MTQKEIQNELIKIIHRERAKLIVPAFVVGLIFGALLTSLILLV